MIPRLKERYHEHVVPALRSEYGYKNIMQVPRLEKIVVNVSLKEGTSNIKVLETAGDELGRITGQKAVLRRARKSIANFKLREGMPVGTKVTLRGDNMWFFLDRLITVAIPRIRDFRGLNGKAFDGRGSYSMGLTEQIIFPEIDYDKVERITGMNITIVTTANNDSEGRSLLKQLGMPFRD
jgi:large subunit ribosomal protein L5